MSVLDTLITDRTNGDVQDRNDKGTYNATDINRVNNAAVYLADEARDMLTDLEAYRESMGVANAPIFQPYTAEDVDVELPVIEGTASRLPDGYTELEYIESTGTQWIDTGVSIGPSTFNATRVVADVRIDYQSGVWAVSGCGNDQPVLYFGVSAGNQFAYGNGSTDIQTGITYINGRHTFDLNVPQQSYTVDDYVNLQGITFNTPNASRNFYISAYSTASLGTMCHSEVVYNYMFYSGSEKIREFIPCKNHSGDVGLYDLVNDAFHANAGTGVFMAGPEVEFPITTRTTWQREDIPHPAQMTQYLANITNLRGLLPITGPEVPADMEGLTYHEANDIEEILLLVDQARTAWLANAVEQIDYIGTYKNQLVSGTFYAGGNRTLQHFSRGR